MTTMTKRSMQVDEAMNREIVVCRDDDTIETVIMTMFKHGISGMPVISASSQVVGVISEKDVVRAFNKALANAGMSEINTTIRLLFLGKIENLDPKRLVEVMKSARTQLVRNYMSSPPIMVSSRSSLKDALELMISKRVNRLPVVDKNQIVGIITRGDIMVFIASELARTGTIGSGTQ
jgi:CBS domain-containing protein